MLLTKNLCYVILLFTLSGCSLSYVVKQGVNQLDLVAGAEPIERALRSKDLDARSREKLKLVQNVREFCKHHLKLVADRNYKDINLSWHKIIHAVSASEPLKFRPYLWWFPIIGNVPYKGFFDKNDANEEETRLRNLGLETQNRSVYGYSTLGYFSDPIWPAMLTLSDDALIELIIHELAHATIYFPNQTPFNETFANFVGKTGTRAYIKSRFGADSAELVKLDNYYQHLAQNREFFHELYTQLNDLYESNASDLNKNDGKKLILEKAEKKYLKIFGDSNNKNWSMVNNAYLLSFKSYNQDDVVFKELLTAVGEDFGRFLNEVRVHAQSSDPFTALKGRVKLLAGKS